jgi:hypothetical protein
VKWHQHRVYTNPVASNTVTTSGSPGYSERTEVTPLMAKVSMQCVSIIFSLEQTFALRRETDCPGILSWPILDQLSVSDE